MEKQILLVDDDPRFRALVNLASSNAEVALTYATSLCEADFEMSMQPFSLLIVDGQLPDGDGLTWLTALREKGIHTPVIFISGHFKDSSTFSQLIMNLGVCLVLQKPISIDVLRQEIDHILDQSQAEAIPVDEEFEKLAQEYASELPGRLTNLSELIGNLTRNADDFDSLRKAITESHMLRGTAGVYGFSALGKQMGWLQDTLEIVRDDVNHESNWLETLITVDHMLHRALRAIPKMIEGCEKNGIKRFNGDDKDLQRSRRVLLFDDDKDFAKRFEALFSAEDIVVYTFRDTAFLDYVIDVTRPELVLISTSLPQAIELRSTICNDAKWKNVAVMLLNSAEDAEGQATDSSKGTDGTLSKKATNMDLLAEVRSHFRLRGALVPLQAKRGSIDVRVAAR